MLKKATKTKTATKKPAVKKTAAMKKTAAKKPAAKKIAAAKKTAPKKAVAKKSSSKPAMKLVAKAAASRRISAFRAKA